MLKPLVTSRSSNQFPPLMLALVLLAVLSGLLFSWAVGAVLAALAVAVGLYAAHERKGQVRPTA